MTSWIRWGGVAVVVSWLLFAVGGALVALSSGGGLGDQVAGGLYYAGAVLQVLALPALLGVGGHALGRAGVIGFAFAQVGIVLYATGMFLILPLVAGVSGSHDVFLFAAADVPVFPVGAVLFFVGSATFGFALARSRRVAAMPARAYAVGCLTWLVAFFAPTPANAWLLFAGNVVAAAGMVWIGLALAAGRGSDAVRP
jgi:hypothetical protein